MAEIELSELSSTLPTKNMSFPVPFLAKLAKEMQLADRETEIFLALFGEGKTRLEVAERLNIQETTVSTCLSGVYRKFGILGSGPVKESRLKDELSKRERVWQGQQSTHSSNFSSPTIRPVSNQIKLSFDSYDYPSPSLRPQDGLIQRIWEQCRQKILTQHSKMRLLLSEEEIAVEQLYVDVLVLNRALRTYQMSLEKLLQTFNLQDRLGFSAQIQRKLGFEVANKTHKLVIFGKPGSGKTTFLKHLAMEWYKGAFQPNLILVLIEFRRIRDEQWHLLDAIGKELGLDEGFQIREFKKQIKELQQKLVAPEERQHKKNQIKALQQELDALSLQAFLIEGRLLILMDSLDEVPTHDLRSNVHNQLLDTVREYPKNRFILTCRTQIITTPEGFASVEVADFNPEQVQRFIENWFVANSKSKAAATQQWETIRNAIDNSPPLKELTVTPVLLSLMCLVLQDEGKIPAERTSLYERGIKLLLRRWNDGKKIYGWEIGSETYRQLEVEEKEKLLMAIAAHKFEDLENFVLFKQDELVDYIIQLLHLAKREEGAAVLKAVEIQHGLLIERADGLWSFSHLTFQEYFTVQWLTQLSSERLIETIANQHWQEIIKQLVRAQQPADKLLQRIKQATDQFIAYESKITQFLTWGLQKAKSIQVPYKPAAIRAFCFALGRGRGSTLARAQEVSLARDSDLTLACILDNNLACVLALDLSRPLNVVRALDLALARAYALDRDIACVLNPDLDLELGLDLDLIRALDLACDLTLDLTYNRALNLTLNRASTQKSMSELTNQLEQLKDSLPRDSNKLWRWWQTNGDQWVKLLCQVMIDHRNIGHDWQFTEAQKEKLRLYHNANKFVIDLMEIEGGVSDTTRAKIEDTLLLPWNELQLRYPKMYGSHSPPSKRQPAMKSDQEVFISYAWGGDSEEIVNQLDQAFQNKGITLVRDKRDLGFKGRIKEFMQRIGRDKCVVVVISEKYLKSENCMYELVQIAKNGEFYDRIFPIVLGDANIYKSVQRIQYVKHWEAQINDLNEAMKTVNAANLQGFRDDIDLYTEIRGTIAGLIDILKDMNTLTPEMHTDSGFDELFQAVECKLAE